MPQSTWGPICDYDLPLAGVTMEVQVDVTEEACFKLIPARYWEERGRLMLQGRIDLLMQACPAFDVIQLIISFIATKAHEMSYTQKSDDAFI